MLFVTLTGIVTLLPVVMLAGIVTPSSSSLPLTSSAVAALSGVRVASASTSAPRRRLELTSWVLVVVAAPEPFQSPMSVAAAADTVIA